MIGICTRNACCAVVIGVVAEVMNAAHAGEGYAGVEGPAHAKGVVVLSAAFSEGPEATDLSLEISFDGRTFQRAEVGLPRPWHLFRSVRHTPTETRFLVPVVGHWGIPAQFVLADAGTYWFRWNIKLNNEGEETLQIEQTVKVGPTSEADSAFLARLSDLDFQRHLFGEDCFERQTEGVREKLLAPDGADFRALGVVGELLKATRGDAADKAVADRKTKEELQTWAEAMWTLAQEFPESSYAPYAAYYGACCYYSLGVNRAIEAVRARRVPGTPTDKAAEFDQRASLIKNDRDCAKAGEAFGFAAERADNYLRPRAICMQASLRKWVGAFEEAEALLDKAEPWGGEGGTIHDLIAKMRKGLAKVKERQLSRQQEQDGQ